MTTKAQIKKRRDNLIENFFQNGLALFTAFIFSVALVGGLGYVLFTQKTEENAVYESAQDILKHSNDVNAWVQLLTYYSAGWLMNSEKLDQFGVIYKTLENSQNQGKLDLSFASSASHWCRNTLNVLSAEKAQIDGVTISESDYLIKAHQQSMSKSYQGQIDLTYAMQDIITNWENETGAARASKFLSLEKPIREQASLIKQIRTQSDQIVVAKKAEQQQFHQEYAELQDRMIQIQTKKNLSIVGVVVGIIWLIALAFGAKKYYFK